MIERGTAEHYAWGNGCDGWHLLKNPALSIIEEQMPPGTSEVRHHHQNARQFFYVLEGTLSFEINGKEFDLAARQGMEIGPTTPHRVFNRSSGKTAFLVVSHPPSHGDRIET
jgi:mannose-6-phosphate isomerase-like protein (cupin superfamily)